MYASNSWEKASGEIKKLEVKENLHTSSEIASNKISYPVEILYEFSVNGKPYRGSQIYASLPNVFSSKKDLDGFIAENSVGKKVFVSYDKNNPEKSALRRSEILLLGIVILLVVVFAVAGAIFLSYANLILILIPKSIIILD